eukprot:gene12773-biopygen4967
MAVPRAGRAPVPQQAGRVGGSVRPAGRSARPRPLRPPVRPAAPPAHASHAMEFEATGAFRTRPGCVLSRFSQGGRWCYNRLGEARLRAAREENEENAAPRALPGARTRATPQRYVLLCYVLPCSVLFGSVLVHPVLACSVLVWVSLTNPSKQTQTNTTPPQHPSGDQKHAIRHRGRR